MKKLVYICSPCRGDYEKNIDNAATYSRAAFRKGYIPITPHLSFTRFMDDTNSKERSMAMAAGSQLLLMCSEVWVFGLDHPSEGMQAEIALAIRHGIPIIDGDEILKNRHTKPRSRIHIQTEEDQECDRIISEIFKDFENKLAERCGAEFAEQWAEATGKNMKVIVIRKRRREE